MMIESTYFNKNQKKKIIAHKTRDAIDNSQKCMHTNVAYGRNHPIGSIQSRPIDTE